MLSKYDMHIFSHTHTALNNNNIFKPHLLSLSQRTVSPQQHENMRRDWDDNLVLPGCDAAGVSCLQLQDHGVVALLEWWDVQPSLILLQSLLGQKTHNSLKCCSAEKRKLPPIANSTCLFSASFTAWLTWFRIFLQHSSALFTFSLSSSSSVWKIQRNSKKEIQAHMKLIFTAVRFKDMTCFQDAAFSEFLPWPSTDWLSNCYLCTWPCFPKAVGTSWISAPP